MTRRAVPAGFNTCSARGSRSMLHHTPFSNTTFSTPAHTAEARWRPRGLRAGAAFALLLPSVAITSTHQLVTPTSTSCMQRLACGTAALCNTPRGHGRLLGDEDAHPQERAHTALWSGTARHRINASARGHMSLQDPCIAHAGCTASGQDATLTQCLHTSQGWPHDRKKAMQAHLAA